MEVQSRTPNSQTRLGTAHHLIPYPMASPTAYPMAYPMASWMWDLLVKATGPASCPATPCHYLPVDCVSKQMARKELEGGGPWPPRSMGAPAFHSMPGLDRTCHFSIMETAPPLVPCRSRPSKGVCKERDLPQGERSRSDQTDQKDQPLPVRAQLPAAAVSRLGAACRQPHNSTFRLPPSESK
jgi:hypothetical protein